MKRQRLVQALEIEDEAERIEQTEVGLQQWEQAMEGLPADEVLAGDLRELEGLLQRGVFTLEDEQG